MNFFSLPFFTGRAASSASLLWPLAAGASGLTCSLSTMARGLRRDGGRKEGLRKAEVLEELVLICK